MLRGQIWLVNLAPTIGSEISKTRPTVIVNDDFQWNSSIESHCANCRLERAIRYLNQKCNWFHKHWQLP